MPTDPPNSSPTVPPPAYILAGGRSVRFGSDKARALVEDETLITLVAGALSQVSSCVTVVAQQESQYEDLGLDTIADSAADRGPVQGLLAALIHRAETLGPGWLLLAACDMLPNGPKAFAALLAAVDDQSPESAAIACRTDRWHPMPGMYHTRLLPTVAAYLADGGRAFQTLLEHPDTQANALADGPAPLPMRLHANTPDQLHDGLGPASTERQP